MKTRLPLFLLPALFLSTACAEEAQPPASGAPEETATSTSQVDGPIHLVDASGQELTFSVPPKRIISLVPSASDFLQALGAGALLVGRTDFDDNPDMASLPSVGGGLHPNLEAIVALEPDLVIRFAGDSDPTTPLRLDELGIANLAIRPDNIRDIRDIVRILGKIANREEAADSLVAKMDSTLTELKARIGERPSIRVAYLLGGTPPWVAGPGSYISELLEQAGGVNVFSDLPGLYGPVSIEAFLVREIDLVLAPEGVEINLPEAGLEVRRIPPALEIPGPSLADNAVALGRVLHPEAFR